MNLKPSNLQDLLAAVEQVFREKLEIEVPSPDTDLLETGVMDSLTFVELAVQLEQTFGITLSLEHLEVDHFRSLQSIAGFVTSQLKDHHGSN